jgi:hypothetical protein
MRVYYNSDADEILVYLGKSTLPCFRRYQFKENGFCDTLLKPKDLIYIGVL